MKVPSRAHLDRSRMLVVLACASVVAAASVTAVTAASAHRRTPSAKMIPAARGHHHAAAHGVALARAAVKKDEKAIQLHLAGHFDISKVKGRSVWYIATDMAIPFIQQIAAGAQAAGKTAGIPVTVFDGKGQVNTYNQGLSEAISANAKGIILQGVTPSLVSTQLARARKAGIPVIDSLNGNPSQPLVDGVRAHVTLNYTQGGQMMADWLIAQSNGKAHVVVFTSSIYQIYKSMIGGFKSEFKRLCPACKIDAVENVQPTQIASDLPTMTSTELERHPDATYFVPFYDGLVTYMTPEIDQGHKNVKIISHDGVNVNLNLVRKNDVEVADVSNPPEPVMGWAEVDEIARLMAGLKPVNEGLEQQLFVHSNVGPNNGALFPGFKGYQSRYRRDWGLK